MKIMGLQKLTLLDFPGRTACTVFTAGCNFRCPFCHNASLVTHIEENPSCSEEEFFKFLKKRQGILDGVCITGGEPTLQPDLEEFIIKIKDLGYEVKLDTNGYNPKVLENLIAKGLLNYVAMDIKNSPSSYGKTVGIEQFNLAPIEESINILKNSGVDYEFRTTVVKELHTPQDIVAIGKWISGAKKYFLQSFVDSGDLIKDGLHGYDKKEMEKLVKLLEKDVPTAALRGQ